MEKLTDNTNKIGKLNLDGQKNNPRRGLKRKRTNGKAPGEKAGTGGKKNPKPVVTSNPKRRTVAKGQLSKFLFI